MVVFIFHKAILNELINFISMNKPLSRIFHWWNLSLLIGNSTLIQVMNIEISRVWNKTKWPVEKCQSPKSEKSICLMKNNKFLIATRAENTKSECWMIFTCQMNEMRLHWSTERNKLLDKYLLFRIILEFTKNYTYYEWYLLCIILHYVLYLTLLFYYFVFSFSHLLQNLSTS